MDILAKQTSDAQDTGFAIRTLSSYFQDCNFMKTIIFMVFLTTIQPRIYIVIFCKIVSLTSSMFFCFYTFSHCSLASLDWWWSCDGFVQIWEDDDLVLCKKTILVRRSRKWHLFVSLLFPKNFYFSPKLAPTLKPDSFCIHARQQQQHARQSP